MRYAGIGSRETPEDVLEFMKTLAMQFASRGAILRTGGADGADNAFLQGALEAKGQVELYLPWPGFNGHQQGIVCGDDPGLQKTASQHHPAWGALTRGGRALHTRNVAQVLGTTGDQPSDLVICWTQEGSGKGGTGQAIRIAKHFNVPVFDLGNRKNFEALQTFLELTSLLEE